MAGPLAFAGREGELSQLLGGAGWRCPDGAGGGDAGVGKTTFAGAGMGRAAAAGMVVVQGECLPVAGALPLLPVVAAQPELLGLQGR
jgi:hypothetical protein